MATPIASLETLARQQTNTEEWEGVTNAEVRSYLNLELAELYDLVITAHEDYNVTTATRTISSVSAAAEYGSFAVPDDFLRARRVSRQQSGRWERVDRLPSLEAIDAAILAYKLVERSVMIVPRERAIGTYLLWYVPVFTPIAEGANLPAAIDYNAWHCFAVAGACARIMRKQELDDSAFLREKAAQQVRVLNACQTRDAGPAVAATDVRGSLDDPFFPRRRFNPWP